MTDLVQYDKWGDSGMRVLVVGPTSYFGRRLTQRLFNSEGIRLRLLVRDIRRVEDTVRQNAEIVDGDVSDRDVLRRALRDIDVAYFPIRFFETDKEFSRLSQSFAEEFRDACIEAGVKRIVYLGVAGREDTGDIWMSTAARIGELLSSCPENMSTIWLRTGFVIGSGSALFEMLRNLIQKCPVLPIPQWTEMKINAIGVDDILEYLVQAKDLEVQDSVIVTVSMPAMSFREMLTVSAKVMRLRRLLIALPCKAYRMSSLLLGLLTPFSFSVASLLIRMIDSGVNLHSDTGNDSAQKYFPQISPLPFEEAVERAIESVEKEQVISRWIDSLAGISYADDEYDIRSSVYRDIKRKSFGDIPPHRIFQAVKSIGGRRGWFTFDFLWQMRGLLDKFAGGFGTSVGKRVESDVRIGDMIDVWKVVDVQENRRLLLEAQMKVFGKAWLEFTIEGNTLTQTAYHYPRGLMGRLYWYSMLPFHLFIFRDMIAAIVRRAHEDD